MSLFVLETEPVTQAATSISSISKEVSSVGDTVSGYDTSCEDDFDFASPSALIASNIAACVTKMQNTQQLITTVVDSHTSLQQSLEYSKPPQEERSAQSTTTTTNSTSITQTETPPVASPVSPLPPNPVSMTVTASNTSANVSAGTTYIPQDPLATSVENTATSISSLAGVGISLATGLGNLKAQSAQNANSEEERAKPNQKTEEKDQKEEKDSKEEEEKETTQKEQVEKEITPTIEKVQCATVKDEAKLGEDAKKIFTAQTFTYNRQGYATYNDKFVISCDQSYGRVGDEITFVKKDGSKVECVIGNITTSTTNEKTVSFIVDEEKWQSSNDHNVTTNLLEEIDKVVKVEKTANPPAELTNAPQTGIEGRRERGEE